MKDKYNEKVLKVYNQLKQSLFGYEVNGNPSKREHYLLNAAVYIVSKSEKTKENKRKQ